MRMSSINLSVLLNAVAKGVTGCLRMTKVARFVNEAKGLGLLKHLENMSVYI